MGGGGAGRHDRRVALGAGPGILRVRWGLNEIITTLMMNYVALNVTSWLVKGPVKDPAVVPPQTVLIPREMRLPAIPGTTSTSVFIVGLIVVVLVTILFRHTVFGFMLDVLGSEPPGRHPCRHAGQPADAGRRCWRAAPWPGWLERTTSSV